MSSHFDKHSVVVVGGGISGLSAAYFLVNAGLRPVLIEKSGRVGGLIKTDLVDGCQLEAGPDSFIAAKPAVAELAKQLGIDDQIIGSNDERRRIFIVRNNELVPMPTGMVMMVPGDLGSALRSRFFSLSSKFRFVTEQFAKPRTRQDDISIREFVNDHFGSESLEYLTEPLLAGVYGGDAGALSARSVLPRFMEYERQYGSLIRAVRKERRTAESKTSAFLSFKGGMQTLTNALECAIKPSVQTITAAVTSVEQTEAGWRVHFGDGHIDTANVLLACPTHVSSYLLAAAAPALADELSSIDYSSAILVTLIYDRQKLVHPLDGFGYLIPSRERRGVAAATWVSTKFPSRTPTNRVALRAFIVGTDAIRLMGSSDEELIEIVRHDYRRLMHIEPVPLFSTCYRWQASMPQYTVGHHKRVVEIEEHVATLPGLHLCGNAFDGVGVPDCIRRAKQIVQKMVTHVT